MTIKTGNSVPLVLQVYDGASNVYPQAKVFSPTGAEITSVNLQHNSDGLYAGSFVMPNSPFVTVQYATYNDPSYLQLSSTYTMAAEVFFQASVPASSFFESELFGQIDDLSLEGTIIE